MGLVSRVDGGLVLAEQSMDGAAVERALKRRDPDLQLQGWPSRTHDCIIWKVVRAVPDRPPETVCVWQSDRGEPFPLSSGLLDLVDRLDRNARGGYKNEDQLNRERHERGRKQIDADLDALRDDWLTTEGKNPVFHRGPHLRRRREFG